MTIQFHLIHAFYWFVVFSTAAGLYYLAELVEEYTVIAKKAITILVLFVSTVYLMFIFMDNLPWSMVTCGIISQILHAVILSDFPYVKLMSFQFIGAVVLLFVNHYLAFSFFTQNYFNFSEVSRLLHRMYMKFFQFYFWTWRHFNAFFLSKK